MESELEVNTQNSFCMKHDKFFWFHDLSYVNKDMDSYPKFFL